MPIGKIAGMPPPGSGFARVRDEFGTEYSVDIKELPKHAKEGDDMAYRVDVFHNESGLATTLRKVED